MTNKEAIQMLERMLDPDPWEDYGLSDMAKEALQIAIDTLENMSQNKGKHNRGKIMFVEFITGEYTNNRYPTSHSIMINTSEISVVEEYPGDYYKTNIITKAGKPYIINEKYKDVVKKIINMERKNNGK